MTEATAYDMGERTALMGLDFLTVAGGIALGMTDSDEFCRLYEAFERGNANGVAIIDRFLTHYRKV